MKSILLMGIKHCGKSSMGKLLSKKMDLSFYDSDLVLEEMTGKTCRQIYSEEGEEAFKKAECLAFKKILEEINLSQNKKAIIASGGGFCKNKEAIEFLKDSCTFVFLKTQEKIASSRILKEAKFDSQGKLTNLPAYIAKKNPQTKKDVQEIFHTFYTERNQIYQELADVTVQMTSESPKKNCAYILSAIQSN